MRNKLLAVSISFLLLFSCFNFVLAQFAGEGLETDWPEIGSQTVAKETGLPGLIRYVFNFSLLIAGIAAFLALVVSGFRYLTSSGKPEVMGDAKKGVFAAFLGLVILLGSYLLLTTLNPELLILRLESVPLEKGIRISAQNAYATGEEKKWVVWKIGFNVADFQDKYQKDKPDHIPQQIQVLEQGKVKVVLYREKDFKGASPATTYGSSDSSNLWVSLEGLGFYTDKTIDPKHPLPTIGSIAIRYIVPGVYLYKDQEMREELFLFSHHSNLASDNFEDKAELIEFKNDIMTDFYIMTDFLAILFQDPDFQGRCRVFFEERDIGGLPFGNMPPDDLRTPESEAVARVHKPTVDNPNTKFNELDDWKKYGDVGGVSSAQRFLLNISSDGALAGTGGSFQICQKINFEPPCAPPVPCDKETLNPFSLEGKQDLSGGGGRLDDYNDNVRSIKIEGKCAAVLFENKTSDGDFPGKCQVFTASNPDLTKEPIGKCRPFSLNPFAWAYAGPCASAVAAYPIK